MCSAYDIHFYPSFRVSRAAPRPAPRGSFLDHPGPRLRCRKLGGSFICRGRFLRSALWGGGARPCGRSGPWVEPRPRPRCATRLPLCPVPAPPRAPRTAVSPLLPPGVEGQLRPGGGEAHAPPAVRVRGRGDRGSGKGPLRFQPRSRRAVARGRASAVLAAAVRLWLGRTALAGLPAAAALPGSPVTVRLLVQCGRPGAPHLVFTLHTGHHATRKRWLPLSLGRVAVTDSHLLCSGSMVRRPLRCWHWLFRLGLPSRRCSVSLP